MLLCWSSTALSVILAVLGIALMEEKEENLALATKKTFAVQSVLFLFAQAFTVAKTLRDFHLGRSGAASPEVAPTRAYMVQVLVFFGLAMVCAVYSLIIISDGKEWRAFFAMMILWLTLNAFCLSKAVRDRQEADDFVVLELGIKRRRLQYIWGMCMGTLEYKLMLWISTLASVGVMLGTMWSWSNEILALERKGYVSGMVLWCLFSSFHLAKLVRDRGDPIKAKELQSQLPFQMLVMVSSVLSTGALIGGACAMPLALRQRLFLIAGSCFSLTAAFYLAKHVRDRYEAMILQRPPEPVIHAHAVGEGSASR